MSKYAHLPFRPNVSIIAFKGNKFLVVNGVNWEANQWKFPQGGIDQGEDVITAGLREFKEEIGSDKLTVRGVSKHTNSYVWPDHIIESPPKHFDGMYKGQHQTFIIAEFHGEDQDSVRTGRRIWAGKMLIRRIRRGASDSHPPHGHEREAPQSVAARTVRACRQTDSRSSP